MGSVALAQGAELLGQLQFSGPMRHSAEIFPAITSLLKRFGEKAIDIEQLYISVGPGSFTGLRIAVTIAKTFALANNAKIVAVDTLDCIAANVINFTAENAENAENNLKSNERLATILDAKRGQFFVAVYENTPAGWEKILPDSLMTAEEFLGRFTNKPIALIGEGLVFYRNNFTHKNVRVLDEKYWNPPASNVYRLGRQMAQRSEFADALTLAPNYLRAPDVIPKQI
jgi:tRNA threonylcarbamoyl adenosine modification protein YeaZ